MLTGKALKIYCSVPNDVANDYAELRDALLRGFAKSADSIRAEFRQMKISSDDTYSQFFDNLSRVFLMWLNSADISSQDPAALIDFIIRDQFLASLSPELRVFLKERKFDNSKELVDAADMWVSAHKDRKTYSHNTKPKWSKPQVGNDGAPCPVTINDKDNVNQPKKIIKCYNCGKEGHPYFKCKEPRRNNIGRSEVSNFIKYDSIDTPDNFVTNDNDLHVNCTKLHDNIKYDNDVLNHNQCIDDLTCKNDSECSDRPNDIAKFADVLNDNIPLKFIATGSINGSPVSTIVRDTGCSTVIVSENCLPFINPDDCSKVKVANYLGQISEFPVVKCYLKCAFYDGFVNAVRAPLSNCAVLVGNLPGVKDYNPDHLDKGMCSNDGTLQSVEESCAVVTRAGSRKTSPHPLKVPKLDIIDIKPAEFAKLQRDCNTLTDLWNKQKNSVITKVGPRKFMFVEENNIMYNMCIESPKLNEKGKKLLVVPLKCRLTVLNTAHENMLSGHFSARKTDLKIRDHFYWPSMCSDIKLYCRSCDICQRFRKSGVKKAPMEKMPIITEPFLKVTIDLIGPLSPPSERGHKYVLTLIDCATSFPEAIPLKNIDTISVAEALIKIFSRVGIPKQIHSDLGTQFVSDLMKEINRLLGIQPLFNTPYHPMGTGRVERLNSTLKSVLRKLCLMRPKDWDRYLIPTLFSLRELPSDRTGYSAFELLYGRQVRGPLSVLRDLWENPDVVDDDRTIYQYVLDLKEKLEDSASIAAASADLSVTRYKTYFDLKSQKRSLVAGDEVLILLPDSNNKLLMSWKGPFKVVEKRNRVDYVIDENSRHRLYHINLLKKYFRRSDVLCSFDQPEPDYESNIKVASACQCVVIENDTDVSNNDDLHIVTVDNNFNDKLVDVCISDTLSSSQHKSVINVLTNYNDVISSLPGCTDAYEHQIKLLDQTPVRVKVYPIPLHLRDAFLSEIDSLLDLGIIRPSSSPYCAPSLLLKKPNGEFRLAIDYRCLNSITVFDAEPSTLFDDELHRFVGCKYFTEFDLSKAYYQIPMAEDSIKYTAFATPRGLMEFTRMPFGLSTACASYIRLMRKVLHDLDVAFYFDNILIFSENWDDHLTMINTVLDRIRSFNLTIKPSKISIGLSTINYLGFTINGSKISPMSKNIDKILNLPVPTSKTALRSFIGLVTFYSRFIRNFSTMTAPLTNLLKKNISEPLPWNDDCNYNFSLLKKCLGSSPILKLPDINLPFVLRTDASNVGIGAMLFQYHSNDPYPVAYGSRKLLERETKYSTIEKELLAVIFGINRFKYYLLGSSFILEVDHQPLVYLNKFKGQNNRLLRWALALQAFSFRVVHVKGNENLGADLLSRVV